MLGRGLASLIPPSQGGHDIGKDDEHRDISHPDLNSEHELSTPPPPFLLEDVFEAPSISPVSVSLLSSPVISEEKVFASSPPVSHSYADEHPHQGEAVFQIEVDKIVPNPYQPRKEFNEDELRELAESIREYGIIQPLVVSKIEKEISMGTEVRYQLIAGERRWRAARLVGLPRVPAGVRGEESKKIQLELALIENIQRSNLNPVEAARAYARLQDEFGLTQREVAQRVGKSREAVANALRLLALPSYVQGAISQGQISESQARVLLSIEDLERQKKAFEQLLADKISVRRLRERVSTERSSDPNSSYFERQLEERLGAPVEISKRGDKGKVVIKFFSEGEMHGAMKKLLGEEDV